MTLSDPWTYENVDIKRIRVLDRSRNLQFEYPSEFVGKVPLILKPRKIYIIELDTGDKKLNYSLLIQSTGFKPVSPHLFDNNVFNEITEFVGKVVNSSYCNGKPCPVKNAVVYVQSVGSSSIGLEIINSTITDENGMFRIYVPSTQQFSLSTGEKLWYPVYQFYVVSAEDTSDILIYYPTVADNDGKGYVALSKKIVLKPIKIKNGGEIHATVFLNGSNFIFSSLAKLYKNAFGTFASSSSSSINMIFTQTLPQSLKISMPSPVSSQEGYLIFTALGYNSTDGDPFQNLKGICVNNTLTVSQGSTTFLACNMSAYGFVNISVVICDDPFTTAVCQPFYLDPFFWHFHTIRIRDRDSGKIVTVLGAGENSLTQVITNKGPYFGSVSSIKVPLPEGNYTIEFSPVIEEFPISWFLASYNHSSFEITKDTTVYININQYLPASNANSDGLKEML